MKIRDAIKGAAPAGVPTPGGIKSKGGDAAPAETPAEETQAPEASNGGEDQ